MNINSNGKSRLPAWATVLFLLTSACQSRAGFESVAAWGDDSDGQTDVPQNLTNVVAVASGGYSCLALKQDGTVAAWGNNPFGQLTLPSGLSNVMEIALGGGFSMVLFSNGTVNAWGDNVSNETNVPPGLANVISISAGNIHALALKADGTVVGWGYDGFGETDVPAGLNNVVAIAGGGLHSLALQSNGQVVAWGNNTSGQTSVPAGLNNVIAIAAGFNHSLALKRDGTVAAWGDNGYGQSVVPAGLSNVVAIAAGDYHSLALKSDGTVVVWGDETTVPVGLSNVVAIAGGAAQSLAVVMGPPVIVGQPAGQTNYSGTAVSFSVSAVGTQPLSYQWQFDGVNIAGATNQSLFLPSPQANDAGTYCVKVTNPYGSVTSAVVGLGVVTAPPIIVSQPTNQVVLFGSNAVFTISATGSLPLAFQWQLNGTNIPGATNATLNIVNAQATDAGIYDALVSNNYGTTNSLNVSLQPVLPSLVFGWGDNYDDTSAYAGEAIPPIGLTNLTGISACGFHSLAVNGGGTVIAWGSDRFGESDVPAGLSGVVAVAAGYYHSLALRNDGTVCAWGWNSVGETNVPAGLSNIVAIAANGADTYPDSSQSLALRKDGTVVGWGATTVPTGITNVVAIAAGGFHSLALRADGTIIGWGANGNGQSVAPIGLSNVVAIAAGSYHSMAMRADGTVVSWGFNGAGQTNTPQGLNNVVAIAAGEEFCLALQANGVLRAWGSDISGETTLPLQLTNVIAITAGSQHALALVNSGNPVATWQPLSQTVYSGASVNFNAGAVGPPPLNYQWQFNGTNLDGATNRSLALVNVQTNNSGNYSLIITNLIGTVTSSNANLTVVTSPPIILNQPTNYVAPLGASPVFGVSVTGSLPVSFQWQFNGTNITGATNATLALAPWGNEGIYSVAVSNAYGVITSSNAALALPRSQVVIWGIPNNVPAGLTNIVAIYGGGGNLLGAKGDGTVGVWGNNNYGQSNVPVGVSNAVSLAAGVFGQCLAARSDGTALAWGYNPYGSVAVPPGLSNVMAVAEGDQHELFLQSNGRVTAWGSNTYGQTNVPASLTNAVAVAAGAGHSLALRSDGTVTAWGQNNYGQTNVPAGLTNVVAIAAGEYHCLALQASGRIVGWGNNVYGEVTMPATLTNAVAIAAGAYHTAVLRSDGTVLTWGWNNDLQTNQPPGLSKVVAVAAGEYFSGALLEDGPLVIATQPANQTVYAGHQVKFSANVLGLHPLTCQWQFNGTNLAGATNTWLTLTNVQPANAGYYNLNTSNNFGAITTSNASLTVMATPPVFTLQPTNQTTYAGSNATLVANLAPGPVPVILQWQFNGTNLPGATSNVLALTNVQPVNQGGYALVVTNGFGAVTSSVALLTVYPLDLPTALNTTNLTWTTTGSAAWFPEAAVSYDGVEAAQSGLPSFYQQSGLQTTVTGPGTLTFWWLFQSLSQPGFNNSLVFSSTQSGVGTNIPYTSGWQSNTFYLGSGSQTLSWTYIHSSPIAQGTGYVDQVSFVPGGVAPAITSAPAAAQYVRANGSVTLSATATGTPPLAWQWQFNGTNLVNKTNAFLSMSSVQPTNAGTYTVQVTNNYGHASASASLFVQRLAINAGTSNLFMTTNGFQLQVSGILTTNSLIVYASTDLVGWLPIFTNSPTTGAVQYLDLGATNFPARFYKAQE